MLKQYAPQLNWSGAVKQWVQSVQAVDDRTIKFTLTGPNPRFVMENLAGTTSQAIVPLPKHIWEGQDPVTFRNPYNAQTGAPIFSGPYVVKRFSSTEFDYKRNDNWWGAKTGAFKLPAPLEIRRPWVGDDATAPTDAREQRCPTSAAATTPSQMFGASGAKPETDVLHRRSRLAGWIDPCPRMLTVNTTVAPWDKKEMRWALSNAINRQQIVDVVYEGAGRAIQLHLPRLSGDAAVPRMRSKTSSRPIGEFNPDKSAELIEGQGYTLDAARASTSARTAGTLTLDVVAPPFMEPWARMVVQQLNAGGIDAALRILEWGVFRDQTGRGQFEAATDWDGCGSTVEPWFGMNRYNKTWVNPVGTAGTEYVDNTNNARALGERRVLGADGPDGQPARWATRRSWT